MAKLYVSNKDESVRLFASDILEMCTHVHWSVPVILYIPVVAYFVTRAASEPMLGTLSVAGLFIAGMFVWTLAEYLLHRFLFHYEPTTELGKRIHFLSHGVHHDYPNDSKRLVMPPSVSIPLAILFYGLFVLVIGTPETFPWFAGFVFGYICYDEIHYATHHAPMKGALGQWLKHHHVLHHYQDFTKRFGVSTPLWDYVFGTIERGRNELAPDR